MTVGEGGGRVTQYIMKYYKNIHLIRTKDNFIEADVIFYLMLVQTTIHSESPFTPAQFVYNVVFCWQSTDICVRVVNDRCPARIEDARM